MGVSIKRGNDNVWVLRMNGMLRKAELDAIWAAGAAKLGEFPEAKVLVLAEDFGGWERGAAWGDISFLVQHGDQIEKLAIVADPKWETEWLAFVGAGFRRTQVRFFPTGQAKAARSWVS